jgi:hypothetical protein
MRLSRDNHSKAPKVTRPSNDLQVLGKRLYSDFSPAQSNATTKKIVPSVLGYRSSAFPSLQPLRQQHAVRPSFLPAREKLLSPGPPTERVVLDSPKESSRPERLVHVGNLSYDVNCQHLKDFMKRAGKVLSVGMPLLPNGMSEGYGTVEYEKPEQAQFAIKELSNQNLMGRQVYIREDSEAEPRFTKPVDPQIAATSVEEDSPFISDEAEKGYGTDISSTHLYLGNLPHAGKIRDPLTYTPSLSSPTSMFQSIS